MSNKTELTSYTEEENKEKILWRRVKMNRRSEIIEKEEEE